MATKTNLLIQFSKKFLNSDSSFTEQLCVEVGSPKETKWNNTL